jgi:hypothetical protein
MKPSFFILSLKHSPSSDSCVFWRADARGYCSDLATAGIFSWDTVKGNPAYYDNGETNRAVPVDDVLAQSVQVVPFPFQG